MVKNDDSSVSSVDLDAKISKKGTNRFYRYATTASIILAVLFCICTVILGVILFQSDDKEDDVVHTSSGYEGKYKKAAVVTENGLCAEIGRNILIAGGNAVDAAIAGLVCIGVVHPYFSGLGGGFLMTLYNSSTRKCSAVDARETAPLTAYREMYVNKTPNSDGGSRYGYGSVATPSELHGFWTIYQRFGSGNVAWSRLFEESIRLARDGYPFPYGLNLSTLPKETLQADGLKDLLYSPLTSKLYAEGDIVKRTVLAQTLERLAQAQDPVELFYRGEMAREIVQEFESNGGLLDIETLANYSTIVYETAPKGELLDDLIICGPPLPSSFVVTQNIIRTMAEFYEGKEIDFGDPEIYHRFLETEKFAYAQRAKMGDGNFVTKAKDLMEEMMEKDYIERIAKKIKDKAQPLRYYDNELFKILPDHGTSSISVIDEEGNAVVITSTINTKFGSRMLSPSLGFPWNNEMDDFSTPGLINYFGFQPSETNSIEPGKRPMSSMSPTIVYGKKNGKVKLAVGASGGTFIISSVAQTAIRTLIFNETIKQSIDAPRFHNQYENISYYEDLVPVSIVEDLHDNFGHNLTKIHFLPTAVTALKREDDGYIYGAADYRKSDRLYPAGY